MKITSRHDYIQSSILTLVAINAISIILCSKNEMVTLVILFMLTSIMLIHILDTITSIKRSIIILIKILLMVILLTCALYVAVEKNVICFNAKMTSLFCIPIWTPFIAFILSSLMYYWFQNRFMQM